MMNPSDPRADALLTSLAQHQAIALFFGFAASILFDSPLPLCASALIGVTQMVRRGRPLRGPDGRLGWANIVTLIRLAPTLALLWLPSTLSPIAAALVLAAFALDGLDGWIARRTATATRFGASLDQESDAVLVAAASLACWRGDLCGPWILWVGSLRWIYVLCLRFVPAPQEMPRTLLGRSAFGIMVTAFIAFFAVPTAWVTRAYLVLAWVALTLSFARSYWWTWGPRASAQRR